MMVTTNSMMTTTDKDKIESRKRKFDYSNDGTYDFHFDFDFGFKIEFNEVEIEVANTLLNFPSLISKSKSKSKSKSLSSYRFSYAWGSKRRRTAIDSPPPLPDAAAVLKTAAISPDTPLVFATSESDDKSKRSIKKLTPVKRTKEKLQQMVDEKIQTRQTLKEGIEKVKLHLEKLKAENYELKAEKQKLMQQSTAVNDNIPAAPSTSTQFHHQSPFFPRHQGFLTHQTAHLKPCISGQLHYPQLGPLGFDLNVSAEEMVTMESGLQPLDQGVIRNVMISRAIAAQARQNRMLMSKSKKMARVK